MDQPDLDSVLRGAWGDLTPDRERLFAAVTNVDAGPPTYPIQDLAAAFLDEADLRARILPMLLAALRHVAAGVPAQRELLVRSMTMAEGGALVLFIRLGCRVLGSRAAGDYPRQVGWCVYLPPVSA